MTTLLVLFILGFIGLCLRYLLKGEFEIDQLFILFLFPMASIGIVYVQKWQYNKDRDYAPDQYYTDYVTRLGDRISRTKKQVYYNGERIGFYYRFYQARWQRFIADMMGKSGQWYLNLTFSFVNDEQIEIKGVKQNNIFKHNQWDIYTSDVKAGEIHTDYSVKNATKLKESMLVEYNGRQYYYTSFGIGSKTEVYEGDTCIAKGKRLGDSVYHFHPTYETIENEKLLFVAFIVFNYEFHQ
ncbi:hypothetical protein J416_07927 [Gracilibacillus halophilus YIM-C55.5]|uniref:Uncharacterized protein n=1 Tax=Gracilibacillus halophilus YIM-C55.5 TaxID=1308866 RepID=N4WV82_9BACI|nr:hypothetical protein [Gracilibacillus halophilus]ENH96991.1 hypothetical protein J416_07927 [Gracilibacillus halophilus YIM-C55.5]